ncbi:hypothetical protein BU15DRAFT_68582 [Melanogaster broomeanus]|nr:hypothetical protein BU15DRAFT_68582 [Melanogaster broomeanus]
MADSPSVIVFKYGAGRVNVSLFFADVPESHCWLFPVRSNEEQIVDRIIQPSALLNSNPPPFPEGVIQGEQTLVQSTNSADVPISRFTSAPDGDLKKNQKIEEIKQILIEMLREIRFPLRKNRLPWFTLEGDLQKHGYMLVNWPSRVPRENDKGIRSLNAAQVDRLYFSVKQGRDTDRLRFESCVDELTDQDENMIVVQNAGSSKRRAEIDDHDGQGRRTRFRVTTAEYYAGHT